MASLSTCHLELLVWDDNLVKLNTSGTFRMFSAQYCVRLDVNQIALFRIQAALNKRGDNKQQALRTRERVSSWNCLRSC